MKAQAASATRRLPWSSFDEDLLLAAPRDDGPRHVRIEAAVPDEDHASPGVDGLPAPPASQEDRLRARLADLASRLSDADGQLLAHAEQAARAMSALLLEALTAALPALGAQYGAREAEAVAQKLITALRDEPMITIRAAPGLIEAFRTAGSLSDIPPNVRLVPSPAIPAGDLRVEWADGSARHSFTPIWRRISEILRCFTDLPGPGEEHDGE